jgi:hypothetical protein
MGVRKNTIRKHPYSVTRFFKKKKKKHYKLGMVIISILCVSV